MNKFTQKQKKKRESKRKGIRDLCVLFLENVLELLLCPKQINELHK